MFNSGILDVAIGLVFIYLLLSFICSAINEMIEAKLKMRATDLERGIRELFHDPGGKGLTKRLYEHPLVFGSFKGKYDPKKIKKKKPTDFGRYPIGSDLPSYIPARNFALALMDIVLPADKSKVSGAAGGGNVPPPSAASTLSPPSSGAAGATGSTSAASVTPDSSSTPSSSLQPLRDNIPSIENPPVEQALRTLVDAAGNDITKARENI